MEALKGRDDLELAFVWNRTVEALKGEVPQDLILEDLKQVKDRYTCRVMQK